MQVILCFDFELLGHEVQICDELANVKITNWEIDKSLQFSPLLTVLAETFQLDDHYRWWPHNFHPFKVNLRSFTLFTGGLILQLLGLVELLQTVI